MPLILNNLTGNNTSSSHALTSKPVLNFNNTQSDLVSARLNNMILAGSNLGRSDTSNTFNQQPSNYTQTFI